MSDAFSVTAGRSRLGRVGVLVRAEVKAERRAGQAVWMTVPFAAASMIVVAMAVGADTPLLRRIGPGVYWAVVMILGAMVTARTSIAAHPAHRDLLRLLGIDALTGYLARTATTGLMLTVLQVIMAPIAVVLYDIDLIAVPETVLVGAVGAVGLAALGTLASDLADHHRVGSTFVPLVTTPLAVPLVLAAVQMREAATYGGSTAPWLFLATAMASLSLLCGSVAAGLLEESSE
ncbi:heme exporter protein CcmB [Euzebya sp.]|uniref:heme exporter protein CcmB n=1 Tax=Euzebya sp. TaxID=1971409 RepID=UPI0035182D9E